MLARCDVQASIPQSGDAESLNVAMAGTVALYELARRSPRCPGVRKRCQAPLRGADQAPTQRAGTSRSRRAPVAATDMRGRGPPTPRPSVFRAGKRSEAERCEKNRGPLRGLQNKSASRWRFRPPRPTGLPLRGCPLFVEPLGRGFDLVALRARCKEEAIGFARPVQVASRNNFSQFAGNSSVGDPDGVLAAVVRASGRTSRSTRRP